MLHQRELMSRSFQILAAPALAVSSVLALTFAACGDGDGKTSGTGGTGQGGTTLTGTGAANGAGGSDTEWGDDDQVPGTLELDPLSVIPFSYLNCAATQPVPEEPPTGGVDAATGSFTTYGATSDDFTITFSDEVITGQTFTTAKRVKVEGVPDNPWSVQIAKKSTSAITEGDILLAEFWARCEKTLEESNECQMLFTIEDDKSYAKAINYPVRVGKDWTHFYVPVVAPQAYLGAPDAGATEGQAKPTLFAGYANQTAEVGELTLTNYGSSLTVDDLPETTVSYPGIDAGASWRETAGQRIDEVRRDDFVVTVVDDSGSPITGATVEVKMTRHEFLFGSAISSGIITGLDEAGEYDRYETEVTRLFNMASPYNAFKWKPWENDWGAGWGTARALDSLTWIEDHKLVSRGHVLVWPSWSHLPTSLGTLYSDILPADFTAQQKADLAQTVLDHIDEGMALAKGRLAHWDVVNEPFDNHDLMDILGDDVMIDWFEQARAGDPDVDLYINDYAILTGGSGNTGHRDDYERWIRMLVDADAPLDGIGLQSHFGLALTGPEDVYDLLDRYGTVFDKDIAITEYDIKVDDENLAACFTHDFMSTLFSHPKPVLFQMWGFWGEEDPLFHPDWTKKLSGRVFEDLIYQRWWTDETLVSDASGRAATRAFHGEYEVMVTVDGKTVTETVHHSRANAAVLEISIP